MSADGTFGKIVLLNIDKPGSCLGPDFVRLNIVQIALYLMAAYSIPPSKLTLGGSIAVKFNASQGL
ncbi:hypothetical protein [Enterocloster citroniae]|uniref:hypothetical protein n=1 Tax=Enterocloster citroniae TaxID=358743 RepID=UPI001FABE14D|nr:hypothetical protein [Enterocloster citroniae]